MQHIDEGTLHAYLDGALDALAAADALPPGVTTADVQSHLRRCDDCRALLERERLIRADAGLVLHDVSPSTCRRSGSSPLPALRSGALCTSPGPRACSSPSAPAGA
jgi:hypothetical protein